VKLLDVSFFLAELSLAAGWRRRLRKAQLWHYTTDVNRTEFYLSFGKVTLQINRIFHLGIYQQFVVVCIAFQTLEVNSLTALRGCEAFNELRFLLKSTVADGSDLSALSLYHGIP
jgi:hypothetical protein